MQSFVPPREVAELNLSPENADEAVRNTRSLRRKSNIIGFALLTQQLVAIIVELIVILLLYLVQTIFFSNSGSSILTLVNDSNSVVGELFDCFTYFSYMFIPFILMTFFFKQRPFAIVPARRIRDKSIIVPAIAIALSFSFAADMLTQYIQMFLGFIHLQSTSPSFATPQNVPALVLYIFQVCILAPFCEEFVFRGVILQNLRRYGNAFAVVVSSIMFSMVHGNMLQMPLALLVGLAFGVIVIECNSIWVTIILHASVNTLSVAVDMLSNSIGNEYAGLIYMAVIFVALATALAVYLNLRHRYNLKAKFEAYKKSVLPNQFLIKKYALTPGFLIFAAFTLVLVIAYTAII
jgi:membrane protease YdiL (CAAX protease family)